MYTSADGPRELQQFLLTTIIETRLYPLQAVSIYDSILRGGGGCPERFLWALKINVC